MSLNEVLQEERNNNITSNPIRIKTNDHIRLKILAVVGDNEYEIAYQVKRCALLIKLKKQYAKRVGLPLSSLKFFDPNGNKIQDSSTCKSSNLQNNDILVVQTRFVSRQFTAKFHFPAFEFNLVQDHGFKKDQKVFLHILDQGLNLSTQHKVKPYYKMKELRKWYGKQLDVPAKQISFEHHHLTDPGDKKKKKTVRDHDTPASLNYRDGDILIAQVQTKERIRIRLIDKPDNFYEFFVNVEMSSTIAQLKLLYGSRVGIMPRHLVFKYKGFQGYDLDNDSTPKSLNMKNGDVIEAHASMPIRIEGKTTCILYVLKCLTFQEIKNRWTKLIGVKLLYKGKEVIDTDTPELLDMDYDDKLVWAGRYQEDSSKVAVMSK